MFYSIFHSPKIIKWEFIVFGVKKDKNDYTLLELCEILYAEKSIKVRITVMFRALNKLNLTLKKVINGVI